jgi:hypothetical protein
MGYNLFLDDFRFPEHTAFYMAQEYHDQYQLRNWEIVRSYDAFVDHISTKGLPDLISFDHDLAFEHYDASTWHSDQQYKEKTGYDCALWLVNYCKINGYTIPPSLVHSQNPHGARRIRELMGGKLIDDFDQASE